MNRTVYLFTILFLFFGILSAQFDSFDESSVSLKNGKLIDSKTGQPYSGEVKSYYDNGRILRESNYLEGELHGKTTRYDYQGKVTSVKDYKYGLDVTGQNSPSNNKVSGGGTYQQRSASYLDYKSDMNKNASRWLGMIAVIVVTVGLILFFSNRKTVKSK